MMTIWRSLPYMLVVILCLCGMAVTAELTLSTGETASLSGSVNPVPQVSASGLSIMAAASDPDAYTLTNTISLNSVPYSLTTEACGGTVTQITSGKLNHVHPRVNEKGIVFEEWNAGTALINRYDFKSGSLGAINPVSQQQTYPAASGKLVAYEQDGASSNSIKNVYVYDTQSDTSLQISPATTNQNQPAVSGRYMVWQDWSLGNAEIALADLNSGQVNLLSKDTGDKKNPAISGNNVVWEDYRNGHADIYLYDIAAGKEYQLTDDKCDHKNPRISGNIVVWEDNRNGGSDIYALDLKTLKETRLSGTGSAFNPDVSGALVVWEDHSNNNAQIMLLDLIAGRIYPLTSDQCDHKSPSIYGGNIVWEDYGSGNPNIYLLRLGTGSTGGNVGIPSQGQSGSYGQQMNTYQFSGQVILDSQNAQSGTVVSALVDGKPRSQVSVYSAGQYSGLSVPVYSSDVGKYLTFTALYNGVTYSTSQQILVGTTTGSGSGGSGGSGGVTLMSAESAGSVSAQGSYSQRLDLTFTSQTTQPSQGQYVLSGAVMIGNQYAPSGTVITALVGNVARAQVTVNPTGQYSGLTVPIYTSDAGQYLTFTALYNGATYGSSQQYAVEGTTGSGSGGSGGVTLMSVGSSGSVSAQGSYSQRLDLTFTSQTTQPSQGQYVLSGAVMIGNQYAPSGTVITALVGNVARAQVTVNPTGQYSGLTVPIYTSDAGQYLTFTALYNGATYSSSQQYAVGGTTGSGSGGSGGVTLMSVGSSGSVSAQGSVSQRLDLTFSTTVPSQSKYCFYGTATTIEGSPLDANRIIYATVDGQVRGQFTLTTAGQYGASGGPFLEVPIYQGDVGKTIRFQTDTGSGADQTQLIVSGLTTSKNLIFSSNPAYTADFTATPLQGSAPFSVKFSDKSTGSPKSHYWDFGDGTTSTETNPTHVYKGNGLYSVGQVVGYWNGGSRNVVKQNYIAVGAVTPANAQIGLNPGWNFISTPKMLADGMNCAKALFGGIDVGGHSIFCYNPRSKSWITVTADTVINPLDAVWIYSTKKDAVNLYFAADALQIPPTKKLVKGWNTFGVTSLNSISAYNTLLSIKDKWVYVIGYDSATQRFQSSIMNVPDSSQGSLYPGYGYWIYMSDEGDLAAVGI